MTDQLLLLQGILGNHKLLKDHIRTVQFDRIEDCVDQQYALVYTLDECDVRSRASLEQSLNELNFAFEIQKKSLRQESRIVKYYYRITIYGGAAEQLRNFDAEDIDFLNSFIDKTNSNEKGNS